MLGKLIRRVWKSVCSTTSHCLGVLGTRVDLSLNLKAFEHRRETPCLSEEGGLEYLAYRGREDGSTLDYGGGRVGVTCLSEGKGREYLVF